MMTLLMSSQAELYTSKNPQTRQEMHSENKQLLQLIEQALDREVSCRLTEKQEQVVCCSFLPLAS